MKYLNVLVIALLATFTLAACDTDQGPMEEAGENVDQSMENVGDAAEDAADEVEDTVD